jgi:hypothetical protein
VSEEILGKLFFFEKKNQKTFLNRGLGCLQQIGSWALRGDDSFLL